MFSGVLGVKESIYTNNMSIWFYLSHYSEQEAKIIPFCSTGTVNFMLAKCLECYWNQHIFLQILMIAMHLVVVQYKTFLQEAQVYLKFEQEHKYLLIVAIKKGVVNDNV